MNLREISSESRLLMQFRHMDIGNGLLQPLLAPMSPAGFSEPLCCTAMTIIEINLKYFTAVP